MTTTTAPIDSFHDLRVSLPAMPTDLVPAVVVEKIANLSRLVGATREARGAVADAERGVRDAEYADQHNLAAALLNDSSAPEPKTASAETALKAARLRYEALQTASVMARSELADAAEQHAGEWRARLGKSYTDAVAQYEKAAREMDAASRVLTSTGEVIAMLDVNPSSLAVGSYMPGAWLSEAVAAVRTAGNEVRNRAPKVAA